MTEDTPDVILLSHRWVQSKLVGDLPKISPHPECQSQPTTYDHTTPAHLLSQHRYS